MAWNYKRLWRKHHWHERRQHTGKGLPKKSNRSREVESRKVRQHKRVPLGTNTGTKLRLVRNVNNKCAGHRPSREMDDPISKRYRIYTGDIMKYGYMQGCFGCNMLKEGTPAQHHNEECRARVTQTLPEAKGKRVVKGQAEQQQTTQSNEE